MHKILIAGFIFIMLFSSCKDVGFEVPKGDIRKVCVTPANIPDNALRQAIIYRVGTDKYGNICAEILQYVETLYIEGQVNDFTGLELLINLKQLSIADNTLSDLSFLSKVPGLTKLMLAFGALADTAGLSSVPYLTELTFYYNPVAAFNEINSLLNLEYMRIQGSGITNANMPVLTPLLKLKNLDLNSNSALSDLGALSGLSSLESLGLGYCNISSLSALSGLSALKELYVSNNLLTSLDGVSGLTSLVTLYAEFNNITDISAAGSLPSIERLELQNNSLTSITVVSNLLTLHVIDVSYNNLTSIYPIYRNYENGGIGANDQVYVNNNPLNANPDLDTYIPKLQAAGIGVWY